ncbi:X-ray radiation resistance-associated protein 1 [Dromaius novaehollandiae]|uniref:X-ray radiation resistance-associated protein 1 n=1 Tax=Dromaius novaehollandiae TaxID=8790 RepID=UPI00311FED77
MATTGLYKMGDGSSYATNCFPARNILRTDKEGAGHWLLARGATRRSWIEQGIPSKTPQQRRKPQSLASAEEDNILDEPFLMKHHCLKNPSDLCSVNISNQNLVSAKEDDFEKFDCVAFINAAENLLTLEAFRKFPGLRELELSLNGLRNLKITAGDFLHLEGLDLSYNNLSPEDIWTLGDLSQLKVLHLTANGLRSLPPDLAGSWDSAHLRFPSLEVLLLDDNRLSDPSVFVSLSNLCSLRELNLDKNEISAVPYLHQAESTNFFLHPALDDDSFRAEWYKSLSSLGPQVQPQQCEGTDVPAELEAKKEQLEYVVLQNTRDPDRTEVVFNPDSQERPVPGALGEGCPSALKTLPAPTTRRDICAPFPELKHLSLAFNKIEEETDLLPVAFFPCLKELTFHSNPLTTTRSGQPPLLTRLLQENLGIKLVRQSVAAERWHLSIPLKASRKVSSHLPKVTKQPLMLEAPAETFLRKPGRGAAALNPSEPLPPIRPSGEQREGPCEELEEAGKGPRHPALPDPLLLHSSASAVRVGEAHVDTDADLAGGSGKRTLGDGECDSRPCPDRAEEAVGSFFMTQVYEAGLSAGLCGRPVEDVPRPPLQPVAEDGLERKRSEQREEGRSPAIPERYRGYEELLGGDTDPDFIEPVGIQKNVQALSYLLKHPLVYRDSTARLDCVQKPYVPRKKSGKMPGPPARRTRAEVLDGILMAMRNTTTITEVPLASVLRGKKSSPKAYREALRLMQDLQEVYEAPPAATGEEQAREKTSSLEELQAIKALLREVASKQWSPKQLQPPRKRVAKELLKVKFAV